MNARLRLVLIGILIFVYIIIMVYFLFTYSPDNGEIAAQWQAADTLYEEEEKSPEVLLADFMNAYQKGDYDAARGYADSLNAKYPGSLYAQRANEILTGLNSETPGATLAQNISSSAAPTTSAVGSASRPATSRKPHARTTPKVAVNKNQLIKENETRVNDALEKLRAVRDDQQQITWLYNKNVSHYVYKNSLEAYIGKNEAGDIWLRMRIYFTGERPLNIESYEVNVADKDYPISTLYGSMERGRGSAGAWEWYDAQVSAKDLSMLKKVAEVGETEIRYIGRTGTSRRMMTEPEKLRLSYIMEAYDALLKQKQLLSAN